MADGRTEGVPNIVKETQAAGIPLVAFDHPGVDEIVMPGETGVLVPEADVSALAHATKALVADHDRARGMGTLASLRARQQFDLATLSDRLETLYRAALVPPADGAQPIAVQQSAKFSPPTG